MPTTDRIAGSALCLLALMWEIRKLPLGPWRSPGPGCVPVLVAALLLILGGLVLATGGRATPVAQVAWGEARHAVVIKQGEEFQKFFDADARRLAEGVRRVGRVEQT
jgi:hypothetical protein